MSSAPTKRYTSQEYLDLERKAETKSEYYDGEIRPRPTSNEAHCIIVGNMLGLIWHALRGKLCEIYNSDMRINVTSSAFYTYPDLSALCGEPQFDDEHVDTLLNPDLLVEILSPLTEDYDRGGKFELYRQIPSLREYLVVAQDRVFVEHHTKCDDGSWRLVDYRSPDDEVTLESVDCSLCLREVYERVEFPSESTENS